MFIPNGRYSPRPAISVERVRHHDGGPGPEPGEGTAVADGDERPAAGGSPSASARLVTPGDTAAARLVTPGETAATG